MPFPISKDYMSLRRMTTSLGSVRGKAYEPCLLRDLYVSLADAFSNIANPSVPRLSLIHI